MLERKGLVPRLIAAIIDGLIVGVACGVLAVLGKIGLILGALIYIGYPVIEILKAQSPGKMIMKFKVTTEDGQAPSRDQLVQRAMLRWGPLAIGGVLTLVALVVPILATLAQLVVAVGSIVLLVLSLKPLQTSNQAIWDVRAKTAVMGPTPATVPAQA